MPNAVFLSYMHTRCEDAGTGTWFGRYVHLDLVVAGLSLVVDAADVLRHRVGGG